MIRVVLVDDHTMVRNCLRVGLGVSDTIEVLDEAGSAAELFQKLRAQQPDVIILDVVLPDASGIALIPRIRAVCPKVKILILTMHGHPRFARHALESGADGYVFKGASLEALLCAIDTVADNRPYVSPDIAPLLLNEWCDTATRGKCRELSPREFEVLTWLGSGLSVKETGQRMGISLKTVSTYQSRIMDKLRLHRPGDVIRFAVERGLIP